jgi:uncharacterized membrane protein HdeD (DUF308 family)
MVARTIGDRGYEGERDRRFAGAWGIPVLVGIALGVVGIGALLASPIAGVAAMVMLGVLLVIGGVVEIAGGLRRVRERRTWLTVLAGALSVVVGVIIIASPIGSLAAAAMWIGLFFVTAGLFRVITSVVDRYAHWGWDLAYGVLAMVLGGYVLYTWPVSSLWLVGTLVGLELLFRGGAWLAAGLAIRRALKGGGPRAPELDRARARVDDAGLAPT